MPDDDALRQAGRRLAADLRSKRKGRGLSADDLRERLGVPARLLDSFESGRLADDPMFNRVYLRSLVRSYAAATDVPPPAALSALGAALEGSYEEGRLEREIEEHREEREWAAERAAEERAAEEEARREEAEPSDQGETEASAAEETTTMDPAEKEPDWSSQSPPGASLEEAQRRDQEKEERAQQRRREREERAREQAQHRQQRKEQQQQQQQERQRHERQEQQQRQRQQQGQQQQRQTEEDRPARRRSPRDRRRSSSTVGRWVVGVLLVAAVAAGVFFLVQSVGGGGGGGGGGVESAQSGAAASDTAGGGAGEQQTQRDRPAKANLQLGNTMSFTVVADDGPVRDLKVTRDQDVRRPYWIEEGQATVFPTQERIIIQNPSAGEPTLQNVRLLAEGYPYPMDRRDDQGRIVITRQDMQAFADTLRGEPAQVPAQRDTASFTG